MFMVRKSALILLLAVFTLVTTWLRAEESHAVIVRGGVEARMRDGTILRADIYRPKDEGKFPVLLERTPYDKRNSSAFAYRAAARGFVVVVQDVRGRYSSDGDWYPFKNESNDGYDTVEWAAGLPFSNGKVGMFGGSYVGATQMLAAITHPPHLAGLCPVVTASNYHDGWTYQGGAFEQWFNQSWTSGLAQDTLNRYIQKNTNALNGMWKLLPVAEYQLFQIPQASSEYASSRVLAPYYQDWLTHPNYDDYWKRWSIEDHYSEIDVPILTVAAWYDIFLGGSLRNFIGIRSNGASEVARKGQHLLVTIGGHAGSARKVGDVDFGPSAEFDEDETILSWYDRLFHGGEDQLASAKPVRIFVMGANQWRDEDNWPLTRARETKYFLHSSGKANTLTGDGTLLQTAPRSETADRYVYNPSNPVPTVGGPLCCDASHLEPGARDQRAVEAREDVLVYSTPPLSQDLEVTGPVQLELFASSSAVDTDFTGKLVDVSPDGFAQNLTEGIVRARYRDSQTQPAFMNPGQTYRLKIDLWSTSNVFRKGHKLRVEISSSNFPRFDRNLNTCEGNGSTLTFVSATNTIYHDVEHPSALILPIVPTP